MADQGKERLVVAVPVRADQLACFVENPAGFLIVRYAVVFIMWRSDQVFIRVVADYHYAARAVGCQAHLLQVFLLLESEKIHHLVRVVVKSVDHLLETHVLVHQLAERRAHHRQVSHALAAEFVQHCLGLLETRLVVCVLNHYPHDIQVGKLPDIMLARCPGAVCR